MTGDGKAAITVTANVLSRAGRWKCPFTTEDKCA